MNDLFEDEGFTLSPRLAWMDEHGISTEQIDENRWEAFDDYAVCAAPTENEALYRMARKRGLRLWNEI
jgi:hypothetical protein